jgi:hypothetical protein
VTIDKEAEEEETAPPVHHSLEGQLQVTGDEKKRGVCDCEKISSGIFTATYVVRMYIHYMIYCWDLDGTRTHICVGKN